MRLNQYYSGDKLEKNVVEGTCSMYGEGGGAYRGLVGKPEGKRPHEGLRRKWENNINLLAPELFFLILAHPVYKT